MGKQAKVVIIGAGPTGLGAAWRLNELEHPDWVLIEGGYRPGGLASSVVDENGFVWDLGGHVLFSHYRYFDRLMERALGDAWLEHTREAWVWIREGWVPYPFQNNIWRLPEKDLMSCLEGLLEIHKESFCKPTTFREHLLQGFGKGICETFMFPYNFKVWAFMPEKMDVGWMGERVATVDLARILGNLVQKKDDVGWGPNATFRFPERGGTGAIWNSLAAQLPRSHLRFGIRVVRIYPDHRRIELDNGEQVEYDFLISTMPLDQLLISLSGEPKLSALHSEFVHSSSHIIGIGLEGSVPEDLAGKCWMYFPESNSPFYRVTVFSNYSPNNVARPGAQWSLMAEVSESRDKPVNFDTLVQDTIKGFIDCRLMKSDSVIASRWHRRLEYGYPTPWLGRDRVLEEVDGALTAMNIFSRGRFGAWKYEVSNQDHSVMQGVEAVEFIVRGAAERTYGGDMSDS